MARNKIFCLVIMLATALCACHKKTPKIPDGSYVAFSLRQAQQMLKQNAHPNDTSVYNLGGITRIVGMVIDRKGNDIILVGKKSSQLPAARFDDLVTALRAIMVYNDLPMVSIDPTPNSMITGMQQVRFGGHIDGTSFGHDFLESDILLKKYSLELVEQVNEVPSYKKLLATDEVDQLKHKGINTISLKWLPVDSANKINGQPLDSGKNTQARFWYNYKAPYSMRIRGNVFCLMAVDITIEKETIANGVLQKSDSLLSETSTPGGVFSKMFADNFYKISDTYPAVKRLKLLFDMTAIADGLKKTRDIPDIGFLLNGYPIKKMNTRKDFGMIKMCAIVKRSDGITDLIQLSGGVAPSVDLQWLNAGDVGYLEKFVLQSRPHNSSLFWRIPIDKWEMPNSNGIKIREDVKSSGSSEGCSFFAHVAEFKTNASNNNPPITFQPPPSLPPIQTKGVQMRMKIDTYSFKQDNSLKKIRDLILKKKSK